MNKILKPIAILSILATTVVGCGGEGTEKKTDVTPEADSTAVEDQMFGMDVMSSNNYQVPSPNELFLIIKNSELEYKEGIVTSGAANYNSSKAQALNFGRLTADIAYSASYEKFQESIDNFENLRKLAGELGISYVFDELMVNRVKNNMDNADSLEMISNNSYINIVNLMEESGESVNLSIISAGGFVESIYILSELIGEYEEGSEVIQRLADQKLVMENILDYLNQHSDEAKVAEVVSELKPIADVFLNLKEGEAAATKSERDGKMVLSGGKIEMSKEEFDALKKAAKDYRDSFSNAGAGN